MKAQCCICQELFENDSKLVVSALQCGHTFHRECLQQWLEKGSTCPSCRQSITRNKVIERLYFDQPEENDENVDPGRLQNEIDKLKLELQRKDREKKEIKSEKAALNERLDELTVATVKSDGWFKLEQSTNVGLRKQLQFYESQQKLLDLERLESQKIKRKLEELQSVETILTGQDNMKNSSMGMGMSGMGTIGMGMGNMGGNMGNMGGNMGNIGIPSVPGFPSYPLVPHFPSYPPPYPGNMGGMGMGNLGNMGGHMGGMGCNMGSTASGGQGVGQTDTKAVTSSAVYNTTSSILGQQQQQWNQMALAGQMGNQMGNMGMGNLGMMPKQMDMMGNIVMIPNSMGMIGKMPNQMGMIGNQMSGQIGGMGGNQMGMGGNQMGMGGNQVMGSQPGSTNTQDSQTGSQTGQSSSFGSQSRNFSSQGGAAEDPIVIGHKAYLEVRDQQWEEIKMKFNLTDANKAHHPMFAGGLDDGYLCKDCSVTCKDSGEYGNHLLCENHLRVIQLKAQESLEDSVLLTADNEPEEWSSHNFPTASASDSLRGVKKGGFKKKRYLKIINTTAKTEIIKTAAKTGWKKKTSGSTATCAGGRCYPRAVIDYRDLDAPDEFDIF